MNNIRKHYHLKKDKVTFMIHTLIIICITIFPSCDSGHKPDDIASEFLSAYLSADYEKASSYCNEKLSEYLNVSEKELEELDDELKNKVIERTKNFSSEIISIKKNSVGDTAKVTYNIYMKTGMDSTIKENVKKGTFYMVKTDGNWKIDSLN